VRGLHLEHSPTCLLGAPRLAAVAALLLAACSSDRPPVSRQTTPPSELRTARSIEPGVVEAILERLADAGERADRQELRSTLDQAGRFAVVYALAKNVAHSSPATQQWFDADASMANAMMQALQCILDDDQCFRDIQVLRVPEALRTLDERSPLLSDGVVTLDEFATWSEQQEDRELTQLRTAQPRQCRVGRIDGFDPARLEPLTRISMTATAWRDGVGRLFVVELSCPRGPGLLFLATARRRREGVPDVGVLAWRFPRP
jgi:hypothetical protein